MKLLYIINIFYRTVALSLQDVLLYIKFSLKFISNAIEMSKYKFRCSVLSDPFWNFIMR